MVAGLKADAAFARWKRGAHADALHLYAEVLDLLEAMPIDENPQTRHVHAAVRYCLGWIAMGARDASYTTLPEPFPGVCSHPEPLGGVQERWLGDMSAVWSLLRNLCTKFEVGWDLTRRAEQKSNGVLPLIVRVMDRLARYKALLDGRDIPTAVSILSGMVAASICLRQVREAEQDPWTSCDITPLPNGYWEDRPKRVGLFLFLVTAGVLATCLYPESPLPVDEWRHDMRLHAIAGPDVDHFVTLLLGTGTATDENVEQAAVALRRIRGELPPPKELCVCHLRLLCALCSETLGESVGKALAKIVAAQWAKVSENQRFALVSPTLYAPMLQATCEDTSRDGFPQVAAILKTAAAATGVKLDKGVTEFLTHVERGVESMSSSV